MRANYEEIEWKVSVRNFPFSSLNVIHDHTKMCLWVVMLCKEPGKESLATIEGEGGVGGGSYPYPTSFASREENIQLGDVVFKIQKIY